MGKTKKEEQQRNRRAEADGMKSLEGHDGLSGILGTEREGSEICSWVFALSSVGSKPAIH